MKCNKCGSEWKTDVSRSVSLTVCPFCQEKIGAEKTSEWKFFDNTKELLAYVAAEYGSDALFGRKYFSDHTSPLMPPGQKNLVKQAFDCGAVKILQDNMSSDQAHKEISVKQAVGKLIDTYASAKDAAERVVWEFTNAIGWSMPEPQNQSQPQTAAPALTAISPSPALPPGESNPLMIRAWLFAEDGDWKEAADYFNKVLDAAPTYAPAYLGLLCVDLKVSQEDELANLNDPGRITNHKYYKRAVADPAVKAHLKNCLQIIKDRIAEESEKPHKIPEEAAVNESDCYVATRMEIFESDGSIENNSPRIFSSQFSQSESRYINICLFFTRNLSINTNVTLHWDIYDSSGHPFSQHQTTTLPIFADTESLTHGWGWEVPGNWPTGSYTVRAYVENSNVLESSFQIFSGGYSYYKFKLKKCRLFSAGDEAPALGQREYTNLFDSSNLCRVYFEYNFAVPKQQQYTTMNYKIFNPQNELQTNSRIPISINTSNDVSWVGFGWSQPGRWAKGIYRYEVSIGGSNTISGRFEVR